MALRKYGTERAPDAQVEGDPETLAALGAPESDEESDDAVEHEESDDR